MTYETEIDIYVYLDREPYKLHFTNKDKIYSGGFYGDRAVNASKYSRLQRLRLPKEYLISSVPTMLNVKLLCLSFFSKVSNHLRLHVLIILSPCQEIIQKTC